MKKILLLLGVLTLTSFTQTERMYEVRVRGSWHACSRTETFYIRARTRAMAEEEAHMQMMWRIKTTTVSVKEAKKK